MVCRAASFGGCRAIGTQLAKVQFIDEYIEHPHRIGVRDLIIQALGQ